jgi:Ser/Thr protein kinase RdoA (MazF antagonist)
VFVPRIFFLSLNLIINQQLIFMPAQILAAYGIAASDSEVQPFGSGLINTTWKVTHGTDTYILQRINHLVFKQPQRIADNISIIGQYLQQQHPEYYFVQPVLTTQGQGIVTADNGDYFRLQPFVHDSRSYDVVNDANLAFEAAKQFGRFTKLLSGVNGRNGVNINNIQTTLADFHNLRLRFEQFTQALQQGNAERIRETQAEIKAIQEQADIINTYDRILTSPAFKLRVTHHDTKISNVLFDAQGKGLCVIDLDTVMPGYFISDFGDMMRTYLSPVSEEEADFSKIEVRGEYFKAIVDGYLSELKDELSKDELQHLKYAGQFMVYMQAMRFLTDYLNNDVYYGAKYEKQNLVRTQNQLTLLKRITEDIQQ